jgi:O-methyltransferase involved in polyketide biosynthesis
VHWVAVDVAQSIEIRRVFLPDTDRHRNLACSALDVPRWIEGIPTQHAVFVTAVGLLKYFQPHEVRRLITTIADRLPQAELVFDVMPRALIKLSQKGFYRKGKSYTVPKMYWGLNRNEIHTIGTWHPNISEVIELPFSGGRGFQYRVMLPILQQIPWVSNHLFSLVHVKCRNRKDK